MTAEERKERTRRQWKAYYVKHVDELSAKRKLRWERDKTALQSMATRFCCCCQNEKPSAAFYPTYKTQCRACLKAKAAPLQVQKRIYVREWKAKNLKRVAQWFREHKEERAKYKRELYARNPALRERNAKRQAAWVKANPHRVRANTAKREAAELNATPRWADQDAIRAIYQEAARLTRETNIPHEVDHIIPLRSPIVCGLHWAANMQILTKTENRRKSNRLISHTNLPRQPSSEGKHQI